MRLIKIHRIIRVLVITDEKHIVKSLILSECSQMVAPSIIIIDNAIIIDSLA